MEFPLLREGTTVDDFKEAQFAHSRSCCTEDDMRQYRDGIMICDSFVPNNGCEVNMSENAMRMQMDIKDSTSKKRTIANKKQEIRKNIMIELDAILDDPDANEEFQEDCVVSLQDRMEKYWTMKNELDDGQVGGEGCLEMYGKTHKRGKQPKRSKNALL